MINRLPCSNCGQLIDTSVARCPFCDLELVDTADNEAKMHNDRERIVAELTNKLWASAHVETILRTALNELGRSMNASRGYIQLDISEQSQLLSIGDD